MALGMEPLSTNSVLCFRVGNRWGKFMDDWYPNLRGLWFVAAQFAAVAALVLTVATIAKFGL
jgi:hypothetical protein